MPDPEERDPEAAEEPTEETSAAVESDSEGEAESASTEPQESTESEADSGPSVNAAEFTSLQERLVPGGGTMDRFFEVRVNVWAELGRIEMPLGELMQLGEGSVLRLNRPIGEPVDLVSQGVRLARGEVVVVDDTFAVRIREIMSTEK